MKPRGDKSTITTERVTARAQSTELLRGFILDGTLAPGERLNELKLAAEFGMSRGPIRESLQILAAEGLVTIRSHKGAVVKTFTAVELANLYEVRLILESHASRQVALRRTAKQADELGALLDLTRERLATQDAFLYDNDFHLQILAMTGNDVLASQGRHLLGQMALARSRSASSPERSTMALKEHQEVFEAIRDQDGQRTAELMEIHLTNSYDNARCMLETFDEADRAEGQA